MGKYSKAKGISRKECREKNICHKCGGHLKLIKVKNGRYLYGTLCELCHTAFYGKIAVPNNPINPNFKKKFNFKESSKKKIKKKFKKKNKIQHKKWTKKNYAEYLNSSHWFNFKRAYYKKHKRICSYCGSKVNIHLHHLTYKRIGKETFEDVVPLCKECHIAEHKMLKEEKRIRKF